VQDIKKVPEDIAELKPTLFVGVPRVFDRLAAGQLFVQKLMLLLSSTSFRVKYKVTSHQSPTFSFEFVPIPRP
jgi:long-subunit acyl-CoA synthetase (AMP-forming)